MLNDQNGEKIGTVEQNDELRRLSGGFLTIVYTLKDVDGRAILNMVNKRSLKTSSIEVFELTPHGDAKLGQAKPIRSLFQKKYEVMVDKGGHSTFLGVMKQSRSENSLSFADNPLLKGVHIILFTKKCVCTDSILSHGTQYESARVLTGRIVIQFGDMTNESSPGPALEDRVVLLSLAILFDSAWSLTGDIRIKKQKKENKWRAHADSSAAWYGMAGISGM